MNISISPDTLRWLMIVPAILIPLVIPILPSLYGGSEKTTKDE
jgi:hypothetical protein